jgi:hypothetical protein
MIDMSAWQELAVDVVEDVELDPDNVRLDFSDDVTEGDIIQDLFSNEKVLTLVDGIAKVGYLTHEIPIVVRRNEKLVVIEGNRRLAALKSIQNPYLAPQFQSQITRLATTIPNRDALRMISVKLAPSEDEARQLVGAIHTGSQRRAWSPNRQAAFFQAQLDAGKSARLLIDQYPTVDVKKFILRSRFLKLFREANYDDLELKNFVTHRRFPVSTLERLYPNNDFLRILGITVDDEYEININLPIGVFDRLAEKVIRDIKIRRIDTRKLNRTASEEYQEYLTELRELLNEGDPTEGGAEEDQGDGHKNSTAAGGDQRTRNRQPNGSSEDKPGRESEKPGQSPQDKKDADGSPAGGVKPRRPTSLDTADLSVPTGFPPSVDLILAELSRININIYPNATMDLLRTFLEKSIKAYADQVGVDLRTQQNVQGFVFLWGTEP